MGAAKVSAMGQRICVEVNSVNRKQSDIVINLPRELSALEPRVRQVVGDRVTRGRTNVVVGIERNISSRPTSRSMARSPAPIMMECVPCRKNLA
jgi:uncharacterized protein YicC (UPF0701 family)